MATPDAVSVKQPRCQEKAIFEFGFPSSIADFSKEHHSSSSSSFLLSVRKMFAIPIKVQGSRKPSEFPGIPLISS